MRVIIIALTLMIMASSTLSLFQQSPVQASDARNFDAGRIIDDGVFTNKDSMTVANIQSFLNSKVPTCDTYGTKPSELGGGTRAQWLASRGISTPITCLKDYYENPTTGQNNYGKAIPAGGISTAQIIYNYSQQFNINPQVLLVTLQKENGLITDEWPTPKQYSESMGFGCPDNVAPGAPACDPSYGSFSAQIYQSARHFRGYINNLPGWWIPFSTGNNNIQWHPNKGCGASVVNIVNRATVALYSYTPYQPNDAAKNAQWGTGDGCSSYGNRNFYMYFTSWFGSTYGGDPISASLRITSPISFAPTQPIPGQPVTISYSIKNFGSSSLAYDTSVIQCRMNSNVNCDPPHMPGGVIAAGETRNITQNITPTQGGAYTITPFFFSGGVWTRYGTQDQGINTVKLNIHDLRITSPITISPSNPRHGDASMSSFTIKNFGSNAIPLQTSVLQCRFNTVINCDSPNGGSITLSPGASLKVSYPFNPAGGGSHAIVPYYMTDDTWYRYNTHESIPTSIAIDTPDVRFTKQITTTPATPIPGQPTTASYSVKNFGLTPIVFDGTLLQCRFNSTVNCDTPHSSPITLQVGEEKAFTHPITISQSGEYKLVPYYSKDNIWYEYSKGAANSGSLSLSVSTYIADLRMTSEITTNPMSPIPGQTATVSYTVQNFGTLPAFYQNAVLQCRLDIAENCDAGYTGSFTLNPGQIRTFTENVTFRDPGNYVFKPYFMQNNSWHLYKSNGFSNYKSIDIKPYIADLRLTTPISISPASPAPGQTLTASYTVQNFSSLPAIYQTSILQCRINLVTNCDSSYDGSGLTIEPGASKSFSHSILAPRPGSYKLVPYFMQNNSWHLYNKGSTSENQLTVTIN